jgi:hypothetical protein
MRPCNFLWMAETNHDKPGTHLGCNITEAQGWSGSRTIANGMRVSSST